MRFIKKALIGLLTFLSLSLVILPFIAVYDLGNQFTLLTYAFSVCLILTVVPKVRYSLPLLAVAWLIVLYRIFPYGTAFSFDWLLRFWLDLHRAFQEILSGEVGYITELAAVTLIVSWVLFLAILPIAYQRFFLIYATMIGYLLTVVIFNQFDLTWHLIGIFLCALASSLIQRSAFQSSQMIAPWFAVMLLIGGLAVTAVYLPQTSLREQLAARSTPIRTNLNQLGFYQFIEEHGTPSGSRTGFSENDRQLGGPLLDDATILFEAQQETPHYWRVESKDFYSGKGWISTSREEARLEAEGVTIADQSYQQAYLENESVQVQFQNHGDYVPLPYGRSTLSLENGARGFQISDAIQRVDLIDPLPDTTLTLDWDHPDFAAENLQNLPLIYPDSPIDYIQLPDSLPQRVRDLAAEITADSNSLFDQVTAIESYLKDPLVFRYSKTDAVVPAEEQDYVDQFLFESQVGYCDNFSTAMVVLLRSLEIPARWAKGFSPGSPATENGITTYTVRNLNAHSWVEVYFDGYGWVPFEPTPSFQNPDRPVLTQESTSSEETPTASSETTPTSSTETESSETTTSSSATAAVTDDVWLTEELKQTLRNGFFGGLAILGLGLLFYFRHSFFRIHLWLICRFNKQPLVAAYPLFLRQTTKVLYRNEAEPLIDYAQRLEAFYPLFHGDFIRLTQQYEAYLYSQEQPAGQEAFLKQVAAQISQLKKIN